MLLNLKKIAKKDKFNVGQPIEQMERYVDVWLKSNNLTLDKKDHKRLSVLLASFFENEESVSETLVFNFLNINKSGPLTDHDSMEIRQAQIRSYVELARKRDYKRRYIVITAITILLMVVAIGAYVYYPYVVRSLYNSERVQTVLQDVSISKEQEEELKKIVYKIVKLERVAEKKSSASHVWYSVKKVVKVVRYRDIPAIQFENVKNLLIQRLDAAKKL